MIRALTPLALLALLFPVRAYRQNQVAPIRVNVDLVSVNARVTDKQGRDVLGLSANDFELLEDGRRQKIAFLDTEKEPITLSVLIDSSSSMYTDGKLDAAEGMLKEIIGRSRSEDSVSVMQFTDHVVDFEQLVGEHRSARLSEAMSEESGGTALYDAVASGLCHLRSAKSLRQAMIVLTDGADQHSRIHLEQLIRLVQGSRTQLFIIGFFRGSEYSIFQESNKTLTLVTGREIDNPLSVFDRLARESGAQAFFPTTRKGLEEAVNEVTNILRSQYTLAYYPQGNPKNIRRIEVKVRRNGLNVRAREAVASREEEGAGVQFDGDSCLILPKAHPFPYESRITHTPESRSYEEDFTDPRTGWPNREGSRYTAGGYELSFEPPKETPDKPLVVANPVGRGALAAYGPWWRDFKASVIVDAGWAKMRVPPEAPSQASSVALDASAAGLIFRVKDSGYYAFLLSTSPQAYRAGELSFKLVKRGYRGTSEKVLIPWTRLQGQYIRGGITNGIKLMVECKDDQITLFVNDAQAGQVRDAALDRGYAGFVILGTGPARFRNLQVQSLP
jgi:Ca-activated chloride channel family protein